MSDDDTYPGDTTARRKAFTVKEWEHEGIKCALTWGVAGHLNGNAQMPDGERRRWSTYEEANSALQFGPFELTKLTEDGWLGFSSAEFYANYFEPEDLAQFADSMLGGLMIGAAEEHRARVFEYQEVQHLVTVDEMIEDTEQLARDLKAFLAATVDDGIDGLGV